MQNSFDFQLKRIPYFLNFWECHLVCSRIFFSKRRASWSILHYHYNAERLTKGRIKGYIPIQNFWNLRFSRIFKDIVSYEAQGKFFIDIYSSKSKKFCSEVRNKVSYCDFTLTSVIKWHRWFLHTPGYRTRFYSFYTRHGEKFLVLFFLCKGF